MNVFKSCCSKKCSKCFRKLIKIAVTVIICSLLLLIKFLLSSEKDSYSSFTCTRRETDILAFHQLFNLDAIDRKILFALVVPDGVATSFAIRANFCPLINILKQHRRSLTAVSGKSLFSWKPVCKMIKDKWTVKMYHNFSDFDDGSSFIVTNDVGRCYACDLLPDIFVVNLEHLRQLPRFTYLDPLSVSAHMSFFLLLKGRSAFCSDYQIEGLTYDKKFVRDFTCNNLASRWDQRFALVPNRTGVYRIVTPDEREAWLGCVWTKSAYRLNLPIHCSNFIRQYLFDVVDIIVHRLKIDYRILYGTLMGALREKDVIPWTVDIDLYLLMTDEEFGYFYEGPWAQLDKISGRRYGRYSRDFGDHLDDTLEAIRTFPMCPLILSSRRDSKRSYDNETLNRLIEREIENVNSLTIPDDQQWRSMGYVDIYSTMHLTDCVKKHFRDKFEWVYIGHRRFKTFGHPYEITVCQYGENFLLERPNMTREFRDLIEDSVEIHWFGSNKITFVS